MASLSFPALSPDERFHIKKINDALYEFYEPVNGRIALEIVFFHGFHHEESYWRTWMLANNSACWINTILAEEFPQSRLLSVSWDSNNYITDCNEPSNMCLAGEYLAKSIIGREEVGQTCPVVLVGHSVGGLVLKEMCLRADQMRAMERRSGYNPYKTFATNMKGAFFYSTPGSEFGGAVGSLKQRGRLLQYMEFLRKENARLISAFEKLRHKHGWRTYGVRGAKKTVPVSRLPSLIGQYLIGTSSSSPAEEEEFARQDLDGFYVLPEEDNFTVCKPKDRNSNSFLLLVQFVHEILRFEEGANEQWRSSLHFPRVFVGMPKRVKWVMNELQLGEAEPSRVSLVGMSGVGKTTLAKEVLVKIALEFEYTCFLEDASRKLTRYDLHTLIANNLYTGSGRKVRPRDADAQSLWLLLKGKLVLMIVDNVDSEQQIIPLLTPGWCGTGSRLIITSRVRSRAMLPTFHMCEVPFLSPEEAKALFHAHLENEVIQEIRQDLIESVVAKCDGLPLTLEVIGSYLRFANNVNVWASALEKLARAESSFEGENDRLWAKLRVSFDDLARLERSMFLDLAVFDNCDPNTKQYSVPVWKAAWGHGSNGVSVDIGLRNLVERCFIRLCVQNEYDSSSTTRSMLQVLLVHEQLRDMGKSISRPSDQMIELSREVWETHDVERLLTQYKGDDAQTEVLSVSAEQDSVASRRQYRWSSISHLKELRLLRMTDVSLVGNSAERFPSSLTFLHMTSCSRGPATTFRFLESDCWPLREEDVDGLQLLSVLLLENSFYVRFPSNFHRLTKLTILFIRGKHLKKLPREFGLLPALEHLYLENVGLKKLPDSFLELSSLESLKLSDCSALKKWPLPMAKLVPSGDNAFSPLCRLESLILEDLVGLTELPEAFGLLWSLDSLRIIRCSALKKLPEGFGGLQNLLGLEVTECGGLESLCDSIGDLKALQTLVISLCNRLAYLPDSLGNLQELESLTLGDLGIFRLPESVGKLLKLENMRLSELSNLRWLPETLGDLHELRVITIDYCHNLDRLPGSFGQLKKVSTLSINDCSNLQITPSSFGQLSSLHELNIARCQHFRLFPESFGQLTTFQVNGALGTEIVQGLRTLEGVEISGTEMVTNIPEYLGQLLPPTVVIFSSSVESKLYLQFTSVEELDVEDPDDFSYVDNCVMMTLEASEGYHLDRRRVTVGTLEITEQ